MIEHEAIRREVGAAAIRIRQHLIEHRKEHEAQRNAAHKKWRDLADQADAARREFERLSRCPSPDPADIRIIIEAKSDHPLLRFFDHDEFDPMVCQASGLAFMEGDETYGDPEYGAVLVKAVTLGVEPVDGHVAGDRA